MVAWVRNTTTAKIKKTVGNLWNKTIDKYQFYNIAFDVFDDLNNIMNTLFRLPYENYGELTRTVTSCFFMEDKTVYSGQFGAFNDSKNIVGYTYCKSGDYIVYIDGANGSISVSKLYAKSDGNSEVVFRYYKNSSSASINTIGDGITFVLSFLCTNNRGRTKQKPILLTTSEYDALPTLEEA